MNLLQIFDGHNIRYWQHGQHHHVSEGWAGTDCPLCSPDSGKVRLGWSLRSRGANCWTCGVVNRIEALKELTGLSGGECFQLLGGLDFAGAVKKRRGKLVLPAGVGDMAEAHRKYLHSRGLDPNTMARLWHLQGIGRGAHLAWRVFIPITEDGEVVSWTTRSIDPGCKTKYINARPDQEAVSAKTILYGSDLARHCVVVVEGPGDVWGVGPGAVCTFGMVPGRSQVAKLASYPRRAVCFDNSPDAQRRARALCDSLRVFDGETLLIQLDAADPGSASRREIRLLRRAVFGRGMK